MLSFKSALSFFLLAAVAAIPALATTTHHKGSSSHARSTHKLSARPSAKSHRLHGQQGIDSERATAIQQALIREHYLAGDPSGKWDAETEAAMQKFQSDQGWQTRLMPDSRALVKLGLGPDYSGAINAKDGGFTAPVAASTIPAEQTAGFAAAAGVNR